MFSILRTYSDKVDRKLRKKGIDKYDGIIYLREKLFAGTMLALIILGIVAYIPAFLLSIVHKYWAVAGASTFAYFSLLVLYMDSRFPVRIKINVFLVIIYVLAVTLIVNLGPYGAGMIWLISFSIIATIFGGIKAAVRTIIINLFTIFFLALGIKIKILNTPFFVEYSFLFWAGFAVNLLVVNSLSSVLIAYFIEGLEKSFLGEQKLKQQLKKKSERLIDAKARAEESDQLKSAFLANVSHEFRTPMNAIIGFTEIMLYTDPDEEKRKKYLVNIQKSSEQLLHIINNTIEYSKIEMGTIQFDLIKVALKEVFQTLYEQLRPKCPENVKFRYVDIEDNSELFMFTDREKLTQIFSNLITNAFKFTSKGEVIFGQMESAHQEFYKFFVKDTGIGIRKEKQKEIFTKFHKEDEFMEGTGLGLSISATLIVHMGGRIWLESDTGEGANFYFILPKKLIVK